MFHSEIFFVNTYPSWVYGFLLRNENWVTFEIVIEFWSFMYHDIRSLIIYILKKSKPFSFIPFWDLINLWCSHHHSQSFKNTEKIRVGGPMGDWKEVTKKRIMEVKLKYPFYVVCGHEIESLWWCMCMAVTVTPPSYAPPWSRGILEAPFWISLLKAF